MAKDAKSIPKENAKYAAFTRSSQVTPRDCLGKQKPSLHRRKGWCSENSIPGFPQERELPPVTNLLISDTRHVLLKWDFPSTNREDKGEDTKAFWGLGRFIASSQRAGMAGQVECRLWLCATKPRAFQPWPPRCTRRCTFPMVENRENILTSHRAKFSGRRRRWKEKPHPVFKQGTHSKVCFNRCWSGDHELTCLWGQLEQQAWGAFACLPPYAFPSL